MIKAIIYQNEAGDYKGYKVEGHAGSATLGHDLVCSAVSALTQTALLGLKNYLTPAVQWEIDDKGYLESELPENLTQEEQKVANIIIHTLKLGLDSIEMEYPKYINVSKRGWNKCCSE